MAGHAPAGRRRCGVRPGMAGHRVPYAPSRAPLSFRGPAFPPRGHQFEPRDKGVEHQKSKSEKGIIRGVMTLWEESSREILRLEIHTAAARLCRWCCVRRQAQSAKLSRSEEHTSELQSPCNLVCRLLL